MTSESTNLFPAMENTDKIISGLKKQIAEKDKEIAELKKIMDALVNERK